MPLLALILTAAGAGLLAAAVALRSPQPAPGATTGNALRAGAAVAIGGAAVLGLVTYLVLRTEALGRVDAGAARWSHDHATDVTQAAIRTVTQLGETWLVAVAGLLVAAVAWRRGASPLVAPFLIAVVVGDKVVTTAIKELVDRARPTLDPIAETLGPSFPSGHTSTAAAFFAGAALVLGCGRSRRARAALAGGAVGWRSPWRAAACSSTSTGSRTSWRASPWDGHGSPSARSPSADGERGRGSRPA